MCTSVTMKIINGTLKYCLAEPLILPSNKSIVLVLVLFDKIYGFLILKLKTIVLRF